MNLPKTLLIFLVLIAAGAGVVFLMQGGGGDAPLPPAPVNATEEPAEQSPDDNASITAPDEPVTEPFERTAVEPDEPKPEDTPQGAMGRVLNPSGAPVPGTMVYLMEATGSDFLRQVMQQQRGIVVPPVARAETDEGGRFQLAVGRPDPSKKYEVRVVSNDYVDHQIPNVTIVKDQWWDAGDIRLENGAVVQGRVTIQGSSGLPVPDAKVMLKANTFFPAMSPTPGREEGLVAEVDHTGSFRLENVPVGAVNIAAVAPGYARIEKQNVTVESVGLNDLTFELPPGSSITGVVVDAATGKVIPNVLLEANSISSKTPIRSSTRSERNGEFAVIGLVDGPYLLTASAPGYVRAEHKPIEAGETDLQIILEKQCTAMLRVYGKNGQALSGYFVTVKKHYEGQPHFGNTDIPRRQARPDKNNIYVVEGLDPDSYVFQIEARGHAKAFSDPVKVQLDAEPPLVDVRLTEGGVIEGYVVDNRGQPVQGVTVATLPNHLDENPFTKMFSGMIPFKITRKSTVTDARGKYRFNLLNPGTYQLKLTHRDFFDVFEKGIEVADGETTNPKNVKMLPGTIVNGTVRVDGAPAGQVKITLSSVVDPNNATPAIFNAEAISDNEGNFVMSRRIPPGTYQVMAARQTLGNPLLQIADYHKTKQEITLTQGQEKYFLSISITSQ